MCTALPRRPRDSPIPSLSRPCNKAQYCMSTELRHLDYKSKPVFEPSSRTAFHSCCDHDAILCATPA